MSSDACRLSEIANIQGGFAFKSADFQNEGIAVVKIANIQPPAVSLVSVDRVAPEKLARLERFKLEDGDILMAMTGATVGKVGRFKESELAYLNQRVARISALKGKQFDDFIYAVVSLPGFDELIEGASSGSAQANISAAGIGSVQIPKLTETEQLEIGEIARAVDDRITLLRETNETLEAIAQALFKSWFVDFDPVRAKAEGKLPEGIDEATAELFPDAFEETELGLVPKGWGVVSLNEYCKILKGCSYKGAGLSDNAGAYMLNLGCFNAPRVFAFENIKRYTGEYKERHRVSAGDLIVANTDMTQVRAILGRPLIVPDGLQDSFISHHVFRLQLLNSDEPSMRNFLFFTLQQSEFRKRAIGYATGTTVLALPKEVLEGFKLTRPSNEVLAAFNEVTNPLLDSIQENEIKVNALSNLRDTLLPRLISGQLRIADAETELEKATA